MNAFRRPLPSLLFALYIAGVFVLAASPLRTMIEPGFQGILYKGGDESQYVMRVNQAIHHPFSDVSNAITTGTRGLQMTFLESAVGTLLGWTGLSAPALTILLSCLIAPLLIPLFTLLALRFSVPRPWAVFGALMCFFLLLGPLRRVVHQAWSLPLVVFALLLIVDWWKDPSHTRSIMLGILLGFMPGVYVWAWTFTWAVFGFTVILMAIADFRKHRFRSVIERFIDAAIAGITACVVAVPFLFLMWINAHHPDAAETSMRSSLIHARELESLPRSLVLGLFALFGGIAIARQPDRRRLLPLFAMMLALVAVLHQQFVHGLVLSFWTHYYPYVCTVSLLFILVFLASSHRTVLTACAMIIASVFLFAALQDYYGRGAVFLSIPRFEKYQHIAPAVMSLNRVQERQVVLSDLDTSLIIGTYTDHDLAYTEFLRHILISPLELSERYCLTQFVTGKTADTEWLAYNVEELSAAGVPATLRKLERDKELTKSACADVYANPKETLKRFGVTLLLWDERNHPDWKVPEKYFKISEKGAGWSLWVVR